RDEDRHRRPMLLKDRHAQLHIVAIAVVEGERHPWRARILPRQLQPIVETDDRYADPGVVGQQRIQEPRGNGSDSGMMLCRVITQPPAWERSPRTRVAPARYANADTHLAARYFMRSRQRYRCGCSAGGHRVRWSLATGAGCWMRCRRAPPSSAKTYPEPARRRIAACRSAR